MLSEIKIENSAGRVATVEIEGTIGVPEEWQFEEPAQRVATYEKFRQVVQSLAGIEAPRVVVEIRSTGGDVNDALLIHDALCACPGEVTTRCYGYVASAATVIAQAASPGCRELSANALYLIHRAASACEGNAQALEERLELLERTDERLAELYAARSGRPAEAFRALMGEHNGNGRWLTAREALEAGLADRLIEPTKPGGSGPHDAAPAKGTSLRERLAARLRGCLALLGAGRAPAPRAGAAEPEPRRDATPAQEALAGASSAAVTALRSGQAAAAPTATLPKEEPPMGEVRRTPNQDAYWRDTAGLRDSKL